MEMSIQVLSQHDLKQLGITLQIIFVLDIHDVMVEHIRNMDVIW
jgi:hypothetical protein